MCHSERSAASTCVLFIDLGRQPGGGGERGGRGMGIEMGRGEDCVYREKW